MDRTILEHRAAGNDPVRKGTWCLVEIPIEDLPDTTRAVYITCSDCGVESHLKEHTVDENGVSNPSYVCPYPPCTWHVWCDLKDWKEVTGGAVKEANKFVVINPKT